MRGGGPRPSGLFSGEQYEPAVVLSSVDRGSKLSATRGRAFCGEYDLSDREGRYIMVRRLRLIRWLPLLPALLAVTMLAGLTAGSALANAQGGHTVGSSACPSGNCRMTRATLTRSTTSWDVPSSTFGYEWIATYNKTSACPFFGGCIIQEGYAKYTTSGAPGGCSPPNNDTSGVKVLYFAIYSDGTLKCDLGQYIGAGESHIMKVARCNNSNSDWCNYLDGTQEHLYVSPGVGATAPNAAILGEFGCDGCMGSTTYIGSNWGTSASEWPWQVGDNNTANNVTQSETSLVNTSSCGSGSNSQWVINNVTVSASWTINWKNGGTSC